LLRAKILYRGCFIKSRRTRSSRLTPNTCQQEDRHNCGAGSNTTFSEWKRAIPEDPEFGIHKSEWERVVWYVYQLLDETLLSGLVQFV